MGELLFGYELRKMLVMMRRKMRQEFKIRDQYLPKPRKKSTVADAPHRYAEYALGAANGRYCHQRSIEIKSMRLPSQRNT